MDALEARWKRTIATDECILPWIVEWAAHTVTDWKSDMTAVRRTKDAMGEKAKHPGIEIGEAVLWRRKPIGGARGELSAAWSSGVFLGIRP